MGGFNVFLWEQINCGRLIWFVGGFWYNITKSPLIWEEKLICHTTSMPCMVSFPTHVLLRKNEFLSETGSSYMQCVLGGWVQFEKKGSVFQELDSNLAQKDYPVDQYPAAQLICSQTVLPSAVSAVSDLLTSKLSCTPLELLVCKQNWASLEKSWIKRDRFVLNWKKAFWC